VARRPATARAIARQVLTRVRRDGAYANLALSAALRRARGIEAVERSLATELVYGVLRHQRLLDHAIARHAREPLDGLDQETLDALRLAVYQILMLERVPAYAAVDDAVESVRTARGKSRAGFVNAVLRRIVPADLEEGLPSDPSARIAVTCSLPEALVERWVRELGARGAEALGRNLLERSPLTARVNTLKGSLETTRDALELEGARVEPGLVLPASALRLHALPDPFSARSFLEGRWTAQDEAAQLPALALEPRPGESVLDACAGVGGKATQLAALLENRGEVICVEPSARKLELLREHCLRLGASCCSECEGDLRGLPVPATGVDRVLVDAPCSGLGVLRRHPELKWRLDLEGGLADLTRLQGELLRAAAGWLRVGGVLVYSVCTVTEEEGAGQVRELLASHPELALEASRLPTGVAGAEVSEAARTIWPHRHGTDGFFIARFRRTR
jgi:16S rRNA (cytosine967-C5)-methyltransferase